MDVDEGRHYVNAEGNTRAQQFDLTDLTTIGPGGVLDVSESQTIGGVTGEILEAELLHELRQWIKRTARGVAAIGQCQGARGNGAVGVPAVIRTFEQKIGWIAVGEIVSRIKPHRRDSGPPRSRGDDQSDGTAERRRPLAKIE